MARLLTGSKAFVFSSLADELSTVVVPRRGFAAASAATAGGVSGVVAVGGGGGGFGAGRPAVDLMRKIDQTEGKERESAWAPDPVTGCYRPAGRAVEIDAAELREMLLSSGRNK